MWRERKRKWVKLDRMFIAGWWDLGSLFFLFFGFLLVLL